MILTDALRQATLKKKIVILSFIDKFERFLS